MRRRRIALGTLALFVAVLLGAGGLVLTREEPQLAPLPLVERLLPSCLGSLPLEATAADGQVVQIFHPNCSHEPTPVLRVGDHWFGLPESMSDVPHTAVREGSRWFIYGGCQYLRSDDGGKSFVVLRPPDWEPYACYCLDHRLLTGVDALSVSPIGSWSPSWTQRLHDVVLGYRYANNRALIPRLRFAFESFRRVPPNAARTYVSHDGGLSWSSHLDDNGDRVFGMPTLRTCD